MWYSGDGSRGLIISIAIGIAYYLCHAYLDDRLKRELFMGKQKSQELSFLIDKLLPINIVVMKYNPKEERSNLHQVNLKAQQTFKIQDNDSFKAFAKNVLIRNDEDSEGSCNLSSVQGQETSKSRKSLFYYMEKIAKDNYDRQKQELQNQEKSYPSNINRETFKKMMFSKLKLKKNSSATEKRPININDDKLIPELSVISQIGRNRDISINNSQFIDQIASNSDLKKNPLPTFPQKSQRESTFKQDLNNSNTRIIFIHLIIISFYLLISISQQKQKIFTYESRSKHLQYMYHHLHISIQLIQFILQIFYLK